MQWDPDEGSNLMTRTEPVLQLYYINGPVFFTLQNVKKKIFSRTFSPVFTSSYRKVSANLLMITFGYVTKGFSQLLVLALAHKTQAI